MDLVALQFFVLFGLALIFQIGAIVVRRLFLSLFFSFIHSLIISVILATMGHYALALMGLGLSCGVNFLSITLTSLVIGSHRNHTVQRRLSLSLFFFPAIAFAFGYVVLLLLWPEDPTRLLYTFREKSFQGNSLEAYNTTFFVLAAMALSSLIGTLLLLRRDDVTDAP